MTRHRRMNALLVRLPLENRTSVKSVHKPPAKLPARSRSVRNFETEHNEFAGKHFLGDTQVQSL